jgi:hypothetical protein
MGDNILKFLMKGFWLVVILFVIRCFICEPISLYDYFGFAGEAIGIAIILMGLYERLLWKYNPLEKIPKIKGEYSGYIEYCYNGNLDRKKAVIKISQSLLSTNVKIMTNEIVSNTIVSNMVYENGEYILYYIYITNPKSKYSKENPMQYGTCRLLMKSKTELQGIYWTTRQTIGDIYLYKTLEVK